jgi:hypothetical protein
LKKITYVELYKFYSSPNRIKASGMMRWARHVACVKEEEFMTYLLAKPERMRPLGRRKHMLEDDIK